MADRTLEGRFHPLRRPREISPGSGSLTRRPFATQHLGTLPKVSFNTPDYYQQGVVQVSYTRDLTAGVRHVHYITRESAGRDGEGVFAFDETGQPVDARAVVSKWKRAGDSLLWKVMFSPEKGTADEVRQMVAPFVADVQRESGNKFDWLAVVHENTNQPHAHLVFRGVDQDGNPNLFNRAMVAYGFRAIARQVATDQLGPRTSREIEAEREREVTAERFVDYDRTLIALALADGRLLKKDVQQEKNADQLQRRLEKLSDLGLATRDGHGDFVLSESLEAVLRERARQGDIVRTLHQSTNQRIDAGSLSEPTGSFKGRVVGEGIFDENSDQRFLFVRDAKGEDHFVPLPASSGPFIGKGNLVFIKKLKSGYRAAPLSAIPVRKQIKARAFAPLDREIIRRFENPQRPRFDPETERAISARRRWLKNQGLATSKKGKFLPDSDAIQALQRQEFKSTVKSLELDYGKSVVDAPQSNNYQARFVRTIKLHAGPYWVLEKDNALHLLPATWNRSFDMGESVDVSQRQSKTVVQSASRGAER